VPGPPETVPWEEEFRAGALRPIAMPVANTKTVRAALSACL